MLKHSSIGSMLQIETLLNLQSGHKIADITMGTGNLLRKFSSAVGRSGLVIGIDRDPQYFSHNSTSGLITQYSNVFLCNTCFSNIPTILRLLNINTLDCLFADLGTSSTQLDQPIRGFSFLQDGPLDMRMDTQSTLTAFQLLKKLSTKNLSYILNIYGQEPLANKIAQAIKNETYLPNSTSALSKLICKIYNKPSNHHPATKTFQALRVAVNKEFNELAALLKTLPNIINSGGSIGILSFHSIEDRIIKRYLNLNKQHWKQILKIKVKSENIIIEKIPRAKCSTLRVFKKNRITTQF